MTDLKDFKENVQFKTELPMTVLHSFLDEGSEDRVLNPKGFYD